MFLKREVKKQNQVIERDPKGECQLLWLILSLAHGVPGFRHLFCGRQQGTARPGQEARAPTSDPAPPCASEATAWPQSERVSGCSEEHSGRAVAFPWPVDATVPRAPARRAFVVHARGEHPPAASRSTGAWAQLQKWPLFPVSSLFSSPELCCRKTEVRKGSLCGSKQQQEL